MIAFDPDKFKVNYPDFITVDNDYLVEVFNEEALVLGSTVLKCVKNKSYWAQIVLAHILSISGRGTGSEQPGMLSQGSEGDVSASFDYPTTITNEWWCQTVYGQKCWQIIKVSGGFTYIPKYEVLSDPWGYWGY